MPVKNQLNNMPQKLKTINNIIKTALKEWSAQGRTKEQIYGARNFMTGRGLRMIEDILKETEKNVDEWAIKNKVNLPAEIWVKYERIWEKLIKELWEELIKALKGGAEKR
jgi:preprotein translocase subunit Sss1